MDRGAALAGQLEAISEELADWSMELLRDALEGDVDAREAERRVTRARRAVEKATQLLVGAGVGDGDDT